LVRLRLARKRIAAARKAIGFPHIGRQSRRA
jgi:hypothetical protein